MLQQIEERILGPVEILHQDGRRTSRRQLFEQRDPGVLEAIAGSKRVQVGCDVEPERQPQDLTIAESGEDALTRIPVEDAELLLEDLSKGPEHDLAVGETPTRALKRLGFFSSQPLPELPDEARLAEPCIPDDRDQQRPTASPDLAVGGLKPLEPPLTNEEPARARPTTTSPVFTPTRIASSPWKSSPSLRCMASAACSARSA